MAKKVFYYSEKELECLKWVSRIVDFGVSLAVISAFNEMYSALYHLRTNKKIFRFTVKKHCNQAIEAALIREQELKSNMINKSFWLDYSDHIIDEAAPDIAKFRSAIKNELDKTALCSSELYSYVECARVLLEMSVKQYDGVMEECKKKFGRDFSSDFKEYRVGDIFLKWNRMCDLLYEGINIKTNTEETDEAFLNMQKKFADGSYIQSCMDEARRNNPDFMENTIIVKDETNGKDYMPNNERKKG